MRITKHVQRPRQDFTWLQYIKDVVQEGRLSPRILFIFSEIPNSQVRYQRRLSQPLSKAFSMSAVFEATMTTIGLLMNTGRSKLAEKLNGLVISEIDEIKSKLNGLARKDLLGSISIFREGI